MLDAGGTNMHIYILLCCNGSEQAPDIKPHGGYEAEKKNAFSQFPSKVTRFRPLLAPPTRCTQCSLSQTLPPITQAQANSKPFCEFSCPSRNQGQ